MKAGSLFSGYGGLDLAVEAAFGARTVWHSEIDPAASRVLETRWPGVPNLGDITAIDWSTVEPVDVLGGGFPCQDVSHAGKRAGLRPDTRSGLWSQMAYAINQLRPRYVVAENVRGLLSAEADSDMEPCPLCVGDEPAGALRALGAVLGDLADLGYDARWCGLRAADVGAPHGRFRVFILARDADRMARTSPGAFSRGCGAVDESGTVQRALRPDRPPTTTDTTGDGRHEGRAEPTGQLGRPDAAERGATAADAGGQRHGGGQDGRARSEPGDRSPEATADADRYGLALLGRQQSSECDPDRRRGPDIAWGPYEPAIRRWEHVTGRVAPAPTETSTKGTQRLSPRFVEWMMGLDPGWVTDVPGITRNDQLKMLGNGVVPQQATAALRMLLAAAAERAA
jgi:DNA (cytosine-5)-methyltransferase 1